MLRNSTLYGLPADIMETDKTLDERRADLKAEAPPLTVEGYPVEGISIGGQETCVIFPTLSVAFDIGRCPQRAVSKEFLFISHAHLDHIGGLPMYVATRGLYRQRPPTIFIPACLREPVERLFELHRSMDQSELRHNLVPLEIGQEHELRRDLKVKAFKTYHAIPSKGYVIYTVKQKLKPEYLGLPGSEIKRLKLSGVEITNTLTVPEIAFTGDTMAGWEKMGGNCFFKHVYQCITNNHFINRRNRNSLYFSITDYSFMLTEYHYFKSKLLWDQFIAISGACIV
ncbi:hypothetical protein E2562_016977 [Oryza meyeriana var. granulata]|uniref:Uncharacterized protein n=1 Tax=Oryza meyeriana var. granulata TaxID=110450 RepID=A0A6G1DYJ6_9ORYZ|nr:hypothetical protein E2562_016977 [Oryza meyeriana var. granulata]